MQKYISVVQKYIIKHRIKLKFTITIFFLHKGYLYRNIFKWIQTTNIDIKVNIYSIIEYFMILQKSINNKNINISKWIRVIYNNIYLNEYISKVIYSNIFLIF